MVNYKFYVRNLLFAVIVIENLLVSKPHCGKYTPTWL